MLGISTWGLMFVPSEISPSIWLCFDFIGGSGGSRFPDTSPVSKIVRIP